MFTNCSTSALATMDQQLVMMGLFTSNWIARQLWRLNGFSPMLVLSFYNLIISSGSLFLTVRTEKSYKKWYEQHIGLLVLLTICELSLYLCYHSIRSLQGAEWTEVALSQRTCHWDEQKRPQVEGFLFLSNCCPVKITGNKSIWLKH